MNPSLELIKYKLNNQLDLVRSLIIDSKHTSQSIELLCKIKKKAKEHNINLIK